MANTYNYLKTVIQNLSKGNSGNPSFIFILLVLWCIPLRHGYNTTAVVLLTAYSLIVFKKSNFRLSITLILPLLLFMLMAASLIWSHDLEASSRALTKGLPLLLIPLCFAAIPATDKEQKEKLFRYYSYGISVLTVGYLARAIIRFAITQNPSVFFYHELVTEDVNAIHVSVYTALALFYFITRPHRSKIAIAAMALLSVSLVLLSSKNILLVFIALVICYYVWHFKSSQKRKILGIVALAFVILITVFSGKIRDRFNIEYESNVNENSLNEDIGTPTEKVYNVSIKRAWTADTFRANDFFPGAAFRVYQIRIFKEMLDEDPIFFTGYGLNASDFRIAEKRKEHQLYVGYENKNFHNQYIQIFAELGILGVLILLFMLLLNLQHALKSKDFMHISFAVLMISLFLTESFLSRQRGIVFFTIMYCLFNSGPVYVRPETTKK